MSIEILGAAYGTADFTAKVKTLVQNDGLNFRVWSDVLGSDPWPGVVKTCVVCYRYDNGSARVISVKDGDSLTVTNPRIAWQKSMQSLGESQHPGSKVSIEYRDTGATIQAVCWYGDGFNTPSGGSVIGTYTK